MFAQTNTVVGAQILPRAEERKFMTRRIVLLVAFAVLVPCFAMAGGIGFSTAGTFSNPSLFPITFAPTSASSFVGGNIAFGMFDVSACPAAKCSGTETFTLTITQTSPSAGTADLVGTISGEVLSDGFTLLKLTFTSATMTIGTTIYNIPFIHSINFFVTTLNGTVGPNNSLPEPSAQLLLGIGVLGLMGLVTVSRKMISV